MIKLSKFAKDLKVTKMTLWNWKNKGLLEFIKIGSLNYVDLETYNKFMGIKEKSEELSSAEYVDYGRGAELRLSGDNHHLASAVKRLENQ